MRLGDLDALKVNLTRPIFGDYEQEVIWKAIDNAPTVEERPTGKWWIDWVDKGYIYHIRCSLCNKAVIGQDNYCPNCGAKMERCEDETDD